jgi:hypothetical protein
MKMNAGIHQHSLDLFPLLPQKKGNRCGNHQQEPAKVEMMKVLFSKLQDQADDKIDCDQNRKQKWRDDNGFVAVRVKLIHQDKERQHGVDGIDYGYHFNKV